ncbi:MAG: DUF6788 family protein [Planctomycetota bacterium]|nr:DUF6788 family protein [Planctomycetota bacterium]
MAQTKRTAKSTRTKTDRRSPQELMLRGSLIELRRRCGKAGCRCHEGDPHSSPALSYSQKGKTQIVTLPAKEVARVKAGLKHYQQALRELEKQAIHGIEGLKRRLQREKEAARRARS